MVHDPGFVAYQFEQALLARGRSTFTVRSYLGDVRGLFALAGAAVEAVTPEHVAAFVASSPARATQRRRLSSLTAFFKWAVGQGLAKSNPALEVERPDPPPLEREFLSRDELRQFLSGVARTHRGERIDLSRASPLVVRDVGLVHVLAHAGLQPGEALALNCGDLSFVGSVAVISVQGKPAREVCIGALGADALRRLATRPDAVPVSPLFTNYRGGRLVIRSIPRRFSRWSAYANLMFPVTPRMLRNTLARHLQEDGAEPTDVAKLLGHARASNTELAVRARPGKRAAFSARRRGSSRAS